MSKKHFNNTAWPVALLMSFMLIGSTTSQAQQEPAPAQKEILPDMPAKVYDKVSAVTVKITIDEGKKNGSGAIIGLTENGRALILTACHVVATNFDETDPDIPLEFHQDVSIKTTTEVNPVRAGVLANFVDRTNDLALLATLEPVGADRAIRYHRTDKVNPGEKVAAFGFPRGDKLTQTVGRIIRLESKHLVFDAQIAPGSSGGPLVDKHGRMIGVSTLVAGGNEGYATNMNLVLSVVDNWLKRIKLQERWEHQKYATGFEKTVKSWPFLVVSGAVIAGGGIIALSGSNPVEDEGTLPAPSGRPSGN